MSADPARCVTILVVSSLYPNACQPRHGVFVEERLRHVVETGHVKAKVVAPVPWFPSRHPAFGRYAQLASVPAREERYGIEILHPRYPAIPKVGMNVAPRFMAIALSRTVEALQAKGFSFDLIDAHYLYPDGVAAVAVGRRIGKRVLMTARGSDVNVISRYRIPRRQILRAAGDAVGIIAVSQALKSRMVVLGVPETKVTVLRNGVDLTRFMPQDREMSRSRLGLSKAVWLSVGHLVEGKGHHLVIEALLHVPDVTLAIIGDGPLDDRLRQLAQRLGVAARVRFMGPVDHADLASYYSAADALILPSSSEGMPNVALESMACGTPVIATAVGGIPEIISVPEAGELMNERSVAAVGRAWVALKQRRAAGGCDRESTRAYARRFSWSDTTGGQLALFRRIKAAASEPSLDAS